jgi:hypothetical protein
MQPIDIIESPIQLNQCRVCHAYIKHLFVFVPKKVADVTDFGPNSQKSLRKANSLLGYFRAFWLQSGIAVGRPN